MRKPRLILGALLAVTAMATGLGSVVAQEVSSTADRTGRVPTRQSGLVGTNTATGIDNPKRDA